MLNIVLNVIGLLCSNLGMYIYTKTNSEVKRFIYLVVLNTLAILFIEYR